jgi:hypothetical protein
MRHLAPRGRGLHVVVVHKDSPKRISPGRAFPDRPGAINAPADQLPSSLTRLSSAYRLFGKFGMGSGQPLSAYRTEIGGLPEFHRPSPMYRSTCRSSDGV